MEANALPDRTTTSPALTSDQKRILDGVKLFDSPKLKRVNSAADYIPSTRDALAEISAIARGQDELATAKSTLTDEQVCIRLKPPHAEITIRNMRRRDAPQVQRLLTRDVLDHLYHGMVDKPGEFCSAVEYIDKNLETKCVELPASTTDTEDAPKRKMPLYLAIAKDDVLIGQVGVDVDEEETGSGAELLYWIGKPYSGQGIMSAVVDEFIAWTWNTIPWLTKVDAGVYSTWNPASRHILMKVGLKYEGTVRRAMHQETKEVDSDIEVWGMLKEEWETLCLRRKICQQ